MIIQLGNMYICDMSLENYNDEFSVGFTSDLTESKRFNINDKYIIDVLRSLFDIEFNVIYIKDENERSDKENRL